MMWRKRYAIHGLKSLGNASGIRGAAYANCVNLDTLLQKQETEFYTIVSVSIISPETFDVKSKAPQSRLTVGLYMGQSDTQRKAKVAPQVS